jgi:hypothetical protein
MSSLIGSLEKVTKIMMQWNSMPHTHTLLSVSHPWTDHNVLPLTCLMKHIFSLQLCICYQNQLSYHGNSGMIIHIKYVSTIRHGLQIANEKRICADCMHITYTSTSCWISGGQSGTEAGFPLSTSVSPAKHSINCSILICHPVWYNWPNSGWSIKRTQSPPPKKKTVYKCLAIYLKMSILSQDVHPDHWALISDKINALYMVHTVCLQQSTTGWCYSSGG